MSRSAWRWGKAELGLTAASFAVVAATSKVDAALYLKADADTSGDGEGGAGNRVGKDRWFLT